jgi:hypothetical protein
MVLCPRTISGETEENKVKFGQTWKTKRHYTEYEKWKIRGEGGRDGAFV